MLSSLLMIGVFLIAFSWFIIHNPWKTAAEIPCVVIAGLLALNFFEPAALVIFRSPSSADLMRTEADCFCFLAIFFGTLTVMAGLIATFSEMPSLPHKFELKARLVLATIASYLVMSITLTACDTSPGLQKLLGLRPDSAAILGLVSPDRHWLNFAGNVADGSLSRPKNAKVPPIDGGSPYDDGTAGKHVRMLRRQFVEQLLPVVPFQVAPPQDVFRPVRNSALPTNKDEVRPNDGTNESDAKPASADEQKNSARQVDESSTGTVGSVEQPANTAKAPTLDSSNSISSDPMKNEN
jgi:hypothetical protein